MGGHLWIRCDEFGRCVTGGNMLIRVLRFQSKKLLDVLF